MPRASKGRTARRRQRERPLLPVLLARIRPRAHREGTHRPHPRSLEYDMDQVGNSEFASLARPPEVLRRDKTRGRQGAVEDLGAVPTLLPQRFKRTNTHSRGDESSQFMIDPRED